MTLFTFIVGRQVVCKFDLSRSCGPSLPDPARVAVVPSQPRGQEAVREGLPPPAPEEPALPTEAGEDISYS